MGLTEELNELNKRATALTKKQDELKRLLAVEEHKVGELATSLKAQGYDVENMNEEQLSELLSSLSDKLVAAKEKFEENLKKAEQLYARFDGVK